MMTIKSSDGIEIDVSCNGDIEAYKADIHAAFDLIVERIESKVKVNTSGRPKKHFRRVQKAGMDWTIEEREYLKSMFKQGKRWAAIARELGRSESSVKTRAWVDNLRGTKYKTRPNKEA